MTHNDLHRYDDMLTLPHPVSRTRRPMNRPDRAAQFSPFAALVGLDSAIARTAQGSAESIEFSQYGDEMLEWNLQILQMQHEDFSA